MSPSGNTERQMLRDTVRSLVTKRADSAAVRTAFESERGYDENLWAVLCEQVGAAALLIPEESGGAGGELADAAVVVEELGRGLVPSPLMGTLWAELALLEAGYEGELLEALAAGESIGAVAFDPGYVVNGDIADVVLTVQGETVCRAGQVTALALSTLDPTRRLASIAVGAAEPVGTAPGLIDKAGLLLAAEQVGPQHVHWISPSSTPRRGSSSDAPSEAFRPSSIGWPTCTCWSNPHAPPCIRPSTI